MKSSSPKSAQPLTRASRYEIVWPRFCPTGGRMLNRGARPVAAGTVVKAPDTGQSSAGIAGGGPVHSFDPQATDDLHHAIGGLGLRNPHGIGFDPLNPTLLFFSNHGADVRETTITGQLVIRRS